jgi:hypothetical protein
MGRPRLCWTAVALVACLFSVLHPFAAAAGRSAPDPVHSVVTVDELLRLENDRAREAVRRSREQAGLGALPPGPLPLSGANRLQAPASALTVESISRLGDAAVRVSLSVDGRRIDAATVGTRVGSCEIVRVAGACIHLVPVAVKPPRPIPADSCPAACWTGLPPSVTRTDAVAAGGPQPAERGAPPSALPTLPPPPVPGEAVRGASGFAPLPR